MAVVALPSPHRVCIALQGGGALGAFSWGALTALLENPRIEIVGGSGTSSGALTAAFVMEGLTKGGREMAKERIADCWIGFSEFQGKYKETLWYQALSSCHQANVLNPYYHVAIEMLKHSSELMHLGQTPLLNYSPLLNFLTYMDEKGKGLDYKTLRTIAERLLVNASVVRPGEDHWHLPPGNERVFTGDTLSPKAFAASGDLVGVSPAIDLNDEPLFDGAYTANPNLKRLAALCLAHHASLIILRTRMIGAFSVHAHTHPRTDDQVRAFFSAKLDDHLAAIREDYPSLPIYDIGPSVKEIHNPWQPLKPELSFAMHDLRHRYNDGYQTMSLAMKNSHGFARQASLPKIASRRVPRASHLAQA